MTKSIIVLSALVQGDKTIYVKEVIKREDGLLAPTTTFNKNEALDFVSMQIANVKLSKLYNPFNREYKAESIVVERSTLTLQTSDLN